MKKLLPWSNLSVEEFASFYQNPEFKTQLDDYKHKVFFPPKIPKICFDSQERAMQLLTIGVIESGARRGWNG